jgi:hypothetical protein
VPKPKAAVPEPVRAATVAPGSLAWSSALQALLSTHDVKWRAILPSGDRVGPFTADELRGWLLKGRAAPKGVGAADAKQALRDMGSLQLCGIAARDYNNQRLPGACGDRGKQ